MTTTEPGASPDPSDDREYTEAVLRRWGWECGPDFWQRYHRDAWVFNLTNALVRTTAEAAALRAAEPHHAVEWGVRRVDGQTRSLRTQLDPGDAPGGPPLAPAASWVYRHTSHGPWVAWSVGDPVPGAEDDQL